MRAQLLGIMMKGKMLALEFGDICTCSGIDDASSKPYFH